MQQTKKHRASDALLVPSVLGWDMPPQFAGVHLPPVLTPEPANLVQELTNSLHLPQPSLPPQVS